ncbi:MAG: hypothetical protein JWO05_220 [Gemmatimonadetes bacterium]|nr:hypothetical protein [Gemmatimonadota bacterium]
MTTSTRYSLSTSLALAGLLTAVPLPRHARVADIQPAMLSGLSWRNIGPFRAGRIAAVSGVIGQPGVFYAGLPMGGVWKTTSAGETWYPVFDAVKEVASIGSVEVAPSDPNVIYAGSGDANNGGEGNGVWKSSDAGRTWQHIGLEGTRHIPSIVVDTRDPNIVLVGALGDLHHRDDVRGLYRSTDGGRSWTKVLHVDDVTGVQKVARAFDEPSIVFATTQRHFTAAVGVVPTPPAPRTGPDTSRSGTALYKSVDGGVTWHEVTGGGLPRLAGRTSVAVAMHTKGQRVFLIGNFGLWRSDDGGASWRQMDAADDRVANGQGGYNCGVYVDTQDPDVVYVINTSSYKSTDGGNSFTGFKGAPGGDDPQQMWIDPTNGQRIFLGVDQGATISFDGGATWSSWYNQSTEQVYHISTDNSWPYFVYATQQDAGAIRTRSRGNLGAITPLDWNPVNGWEWGTIVPDPRDVNTVYSSGSGIVKISYPTEQWTNVSPAADPANKLRTAFSQPIGFAPWNSKELLAGFQSMWSSLDGGAHWTKLSGDLTLAPNADSVAIATARAGIESFSASTLGTGVIWAGTSNGRIQVTRNHGKNWSDVTIPNLPNPTRANVYGIEASHTDPATAYAALSYSGLGDYAPYVFRTRDFGRTWTKIVDGLPSNEAGGSYVRVVRADTKRAGLLFAGTESGVHVSFDDGDHWQSLMLNLPNTSYRDITIKGNDLVVGTYGRGLWVLDDISMLREITPAMAAEPAHLFKPGDAVRMRRNVSADTPFPPEVPHALNPPEGALIYYSLAAKPAGLLTLEILDAAGHAVRHLSSAAMAPVAEAARPPHPNFWLAPLVPLPRAVGTNRVNWDLRYDAPQVFSHSYEINANPGLTPVSPEGPLAPPGTYTVKLTVEGKTYTQVVTVVNDPRSRATTAAIAQQHALEMNIYGGMRTAWEGFQQAAALNAIVRGGSSGAEAALASAINSFSARLDTIAGGLDAARRIRFRGPNPPLTFIGLSNALARQLTAQEYADMAPTPAALAAYGATCKDLKTLEANWKAVLTTDLGSYNAVLGRLGKPALASPAMPAPPGC